MASNNLGLFGNVKTHLSIWFWSCFIFLFDLISINYNSFGKWVVWESDCTGHALCYWFSKKSVHESHLIGNLTAPHLEDKKIEKQAFLVYLFGTFSFRGVTQQKRVKNKHSLLYTTKWLSITLTGRFMFHKLCEVTSDLNKYSQICKHMIDYICKNHIDCKKIKNKRRSNANTQVHFWLFNPVNIMGSQHISD